MIVVNSNDLDPQMRALKVFAVDQLMSVGRLFLWIESIAADLLLARLLAEDLIVGTFRSSRSGDSYSTPNKVFADRRKQNK